MDVPFPQHVEKPSVSLSGFDGFEVWPCGSNIVIPFFVVKLGLLFPFTVLESNEAVE